MTSGLLKRNNDARRPREDARRARPGESRATDPTAIQQKQVMKRRRTLVARCCPAYFSCMSLLYSAKFHPI